jgi:hypothetical protein
MSKLKNEDLTQYESYQEFRKMLGNWCNGRVYDNDAEVAIDSASKIYGIIYQSGALSCEAKDVVADHQRLMDLLDILKTQHAGEDSLGDLIPQLELFIPVILKQTGTESALSGSAVSSSAYDLFIADCCFSAVANVIDTEVLGEAI